MKMIQLKKTSKQGKGGWNLTPKIPSIFLPISAVTDLVGRIHFSTRKVMRT
jgi:hypothetical protein